MARNEVEELPNEREKEEFEMVPPEGGWGYVICMGLAAMFIICTSHQSTLGMIYHDFLIEIGEGTSGITLVLGAFGMAVACSGCMTNLILKKLSLRQAGIMGAIIYFTGTILAVFVRSISHLVFCIGILQGIGFGMLVPVYYTNFNLYFTQKRVLLLSLCKTSIGFMSMVYPFILHRTMDIYGFRGTLIILCGITAHIFIAVAVMQPVEWHMKRKVIKQRHDSIKVIVTSDTLPTIHEQNNLVNEDEDACTTNESSEDKNEKEEESKEPLLESNGNGYLVVAENKFHINSRPPSPIDDSRQLRSNSVTLTVGFQERPRRSSYNLMQDELQNLAYIDAVHRATSMSSLSNMSNVPIEPMPPFGKKQGKNKWNIVVDVLDLSLFKNPIYCNVIIGTGLVFFTDMMFFVLQPLYLYHLGFTNTEVATVISIGATTDLAARVIMAAIGKFVSPTGRQIMMFGAVTCGLFRTIILFFTDFWGVAILTGINGLFRCCVQIPLALVIAEQVPIKRFSAGYGLFMFVCGIINLILGPGVGLIRDLSGSYILAFLALNFLNLCCVVPWTIEFIFVRRKAKKEPKSA